MKFEAASEIWMQAFQKFHKTFLKNLFLTD